MPNFPQPPFMSEDPPTEEETRFYRPKTEESQRKPEPLKSTENFRPEMETNQEFLKTLGESFYLAPEFVHREPWIPPERLGIFGEFTGPSGSGKHVIAAETAKLIAKIMPDNLLITDADVIEGQQGTQVVKNQLASFSAGFYDKGRDANAEITATGFLVYHLHLKEQTGKHLDKVSNIITTWGGLSTWNLMAYSFGGNSIPDFIKQHNLRDAIWELPSIEQVKELLTEDLVEQGTTIIRGISNEIRKKSNLNLCPLLDAPRGITFISGLSLEECELNRKKPQHESRTTPRRWQHLSNDFQLQIRLIDALILKLCPESAVTFNSIMSPDFAKTEPIEVVKISLAIIERFRPTKPKLLD